jgi:rod shape-determining protein MreC
MSSPLDDRSWRLPALGSALAICIGLLLLPSGLERRLKSVAMSLEHPFLSVADGLVRGARAGFYGGDVTGSDLERVLDLMATNARLKLEVSELVAVRSENEFLKKRLGFRARQRQILVVCRVDGRSTMNGYYRQIRLNRGRIDGLEPGMAIVTEAGLVGRLVEVFRDASTAVLISNSRCLVPCQIPSKELQGMLSGGATDDDTGVMNMLTPPPPARLDFLDEPIGRRVEKGDWVYTSGLDPGIRTSSIPIGVVSEIERDAAGICRRCLVTPFASLEQLTYVYAVVAE